jgi:phenylalanyl-tRNA synthetase alpha chain
MSTDPSTTRSSSSGASPAATPVPITPAQLQAALAVRDLSDPAHGPHAMQRLLDAILAAVAPGAEIHVHRPSPIVTAHHNYDRLHYPVDGVARDARYTRWLGPGVLLRSQTSAAIPPLLDALARDGRWTDVLLAVPGLVYRRDCIDRHHVGEPHQLDLWRIRRGDALRRAPGRAASTTAAICASRSARRRASPRRIRQRSS